MFSLTTGLWRRDPVVSRGASPYTNIGRFRLLRAIASHTFVGGSRLSCEWKGHRRCHSCGGQVCLGAGHEDLGIRPQTSSRLWGPGSVWLQRDAECC